MGSLDEGEALPAAGRTLGRQPSPSRPARPTLRDVAVRAHVSFKTVSRVVNNEPRVRPETAERVLAAIRELRFTPNYNASSLKHGVSSATIGLVIADVANPFFAVIARAVEEVARESDHLLVTASTAEDPDRERDVIEALVERRVRGIIVVPVSRDHRFLRRELEHGTAIVFLDRPPARLRADAVLLDNVGGARQAVDHLLAHGHRRIAIIGDRLEVYTIGERYRGYLESLAAAGVDVDEQLVRFGCHDTHDAAEAVRQLLRLPNPPTAIFATNNRMSVGCVEVIASLDPPVALVGFDDFELAAALRLPVTVVSYDLEEAGRRAARLLFDRLDGNGSTPKSLTVPTRIVARGSGEVTPPGTSVASTEMDLTTLSR
jgi:LacI family transcriptional regulator